MAAPNWFVGWPFEVELPLPSPPPRVRAFAPEDRHATLAFLGACGEAAARAAWAVALELELAPVRARLGGVELLGHPRNPSAIAALFSDGRVEVEAQIAAHRSALLEAAGARPDDRPPKAHVTLARIQRKASPIQRRHAAEWAATLSLDGAAELDRLALYTWSEDREARLFRLVETRPVGS